MGALKDLSKKNSNWLKVEIGESSIVKYLGFKIIPSTLDPTHDTCQYKLLENGMEKYWTNGSGKVMLVFDSLVAGKDWVKVSRTPWVGKDGKVDSSKSTWIVEKSEQPKDQPETRQGVPMNTTNEKSWDE